MFEEFNRELQGLRLNEGVQIPVGIPLDDKGYLDRKCPHAECHADFKVLFDDWRDKVSDPAAFCPKCGERNEPLEFSCEWQNEYAADVAQAYALEQIDQAFSRAARNTRPQRIASGLFDICMTVSYHAEPVPVVLPPIAGESLRQDFTCEQCGCRYSTVGAGFFCPACGHNSAIKDFDYAVDTALKAVGALDEIRKAVATKHNDDVAANIEQQFLEDQIENLVTAYQRVAEALFRELPNASTFSWDHNLFQRLRDASELWRQAAGTGYDALLTPAELGFVETMVQRRHKIGHAQGFVDQRYLDKTGDSSYSVGQRLVTNRGHVQQLADAIVKLVGGLRQTVQDQVQQGITVPAPSPSESAPTTAGGIS